MHVQEIYTYPIKSLRGVSVPSIAAKQAGFLYDRHFMLWDAEKSENMHIGLRSSLCLFTTRFTCMENPTELEVHYGLNHTFDRPDKPIERSPLTVPLKPDISGLKSVTVTMHFNSCTAYDMGQKYNEWFSDRVGYSVKLLYIGDYRRRILGNMGEGVKVHGNTWIYSTLTPVPMAIIIGYIALRAETMRTTWHIVAIAAFVISCILPFRQFQKLSGATKPGLTFADLAAYLVISNSSYDNVNSRLSGDEELDITKFRANIVVSGAKDAFEEDFWGELQIGEDITMKLTQNCARCSSLNVDYKTGKPGTTDAGKVLKILSKDRRVDPGTKWSPIFGRYGFITSPSGDKPTMRITVGDEVC
ncbi:hypothetical protein H9L39_20275 [Fusarium oxysporum f. sp. albedinis]|nr:hypothetical protein H9L39_20275 [Fusarium oxysporum f. sp. albedinis]